MLLGPQTTSETNRDNRTCAIQRACVASRARQVQDDRDSQYGDDYRQHHKASHVAGHIFQKHLQPYGRFTFKPPLRSLESDDASGEQSSSLADSAIRYRKKPPSAMSSGTLNGSRR